MNRSSSAIGRLSFVALFALIVGMGCQSTGRQDQKQEATTTQDTMPAPAPAAVTEKIPDSPAANNIKQQPAATTPPPKGHEIKHGSDNDKLLDSIKAAKNKQKGIK